MPHCILSKGLNHDFGNKKMEISSLFFDIQGLKIMFDEYLVQKHRMVLVKKITNFLFVGCWTIEAQK